MAAPPRAVLTTRRRRGESPARCSRRRGPTSVTGGTRPAGTREVLRPLQGRPGLLRVRAPPDDQGAAEGAAAVSGPELSGASSSGSGKSRWCTCPHARGPEGRCPVGQAPRRAQNGRNLLRSGCSGLGVTVAASPSTAAPGTTMRSSAPRPSRPRASPAPSSPRASGHGPDRTAVPAETLTAPPQGHAEER